VEMKPKTKTFETIRAIELIELLESCCVEKIEISNDILCVDYKNAVGNIKTQFFRKEVMGKGIEIAKKWKYETAMIKLLSSLLGNNA